MASNSLTKRRDILRRPIVCKKGPPSIPPVPPPDVTIIFNPNPFTIEVDENEEVTLIASNPNLPDEDELTTEFVQGRGEYTLGSELTNNHLEDGEYTAPEDPGPDEIKVTVVWSDDTIGIAFLTINVIPEE